MWSSLSQSSTLKNISENYQESQEQNREREPKNKNKKKSDL
jgi:hypothetical protein